MTSFKDALDDLSIFLDAKSPPFQDCAKAVWAHSQAIRKALELADRMRWRPIDSAPKPSGQILLVADGKVYNGHWYSTYNKWVYDCHFSTDKQPTHWMPLPEFKEGEG